MRTRQLLSQGALAIGLVLSGTPVAAQEQSQWIAGGELALTDVRGNQSLTLFSTRASLRATGGRKADLALQVGARYGRTGDSVVVEDYTGSAEVRFDPQRRLSPFVAVTAARDDIRQIQVRLSAAVGVDLNLRPDTARVALGLAVLQDYESAELPAGAGDATTSLTRMSFRVEAIQPLRPGVSLRHRSTVEPVASDLGDHLITSETGLRVLLTRRLAVQTTFLFNRDSSPPFGVSFKNDRTLTVGIIVESQ